MLKAVDKARRTVSRGLCCFAYDIRSAELVLDNFKVIQIHCDGRVSVLMRDQVVVVNTSAFSDISGAFVSVKCHSNLP
jgi:hypothetical protein